MKKQDDAHSNSQWIRVATSLVKNILTPWNVYGKMKIYECFVVLKSGIAPDVVEYSVDTMEKMEIQQMAEKMIGCSCAELVVPVGLMGRYAFFVDEDGVKNEKPVNYFGSVLYGTDENHCPIYGDAMVVKLTSQNIEVEWLKKKDVPEIKRLIRASEMRFHSNMNALFDRYNKEK